jgi:hypothetical protein
MTTHLHFYTAKPGQGCSVIAAATALSLEGNILLMDHNDDLAAVLGVGFKDIVTVVKDNVNLTRKTNEDTKDYDFVVHDWGNVPPPSYGHSFLVTTACYLALRKAVALAVRPDAIILHEQQGRALTEKDVATAIGAPLVAVVPNDPTVARSIDAGLLSVRMPRPLGRALESVVQHISANAAVSK